MFYAKRFSVKFEASAGPGVQLFPSLFGNSKPRFRFRHVTQSYLVRFITMAYMTQRVVIMQSALIALFRDFSLLRGST
jgi:hypothetical protein